MSKKKRFKLTSELINRSFALIDGTAVPSDFGWDITQGGVLLGVFCVYLEKLLAAKDTPEELKPNLSASLEKAKNLGQTYTEAGRAIGEWDWDKP